MSEAADGERSRPGGSSTNGHDRRRFGKNLRVRNRREFLAIQRHGKSRSTRHFIVLTLSRDRGGPARVGITVSRKVGNAVARNHVKRRVREFFRRHHNDIPPAQDFVFIARSGADKLSYADVANELRKATGL